MAANKKTPKKAAGKDSKKSKRAARGKKTVKRSLVNELKKISTAILILVGVVSIIAMGADFYIGRHKGKSAKKEVAIVESVKPEGTKRAEPDSSRVKQRVSKKPDPSGQEAKQAQPAKQVQPDKRVVNSPAHPIFEVFDDGHEIPERLPSGVKPGLQDKIPRVVIIIDDIGFDKKLSLALAGLDPGLTLSILPGAPHAKAIAEALHQRGTEILLHLPMEPMEYPRVDPGPGALLSTMTPDELLYHLRENLDAVPHVAGVNNHMGSRMTTLSPQMKQIFTVLKQRNLFFVDSLTAKESLCRACAELLQVPFAQRDVFLDNVQDQDYIKKQLDLLLDIAVRHGTAIGIGHPYKATFLTLQSEIPRLKKKVQIIPASALVTIPG
ncbi:MAG: divergent polysaccharide deacetylase family protein [Desulfobacterium sp.]|nr:divergent polysaccharide deacetylase family protein [Desulfobacterium sp.]